MAATQCMKACRHGQDELMFDLSIRIGMKGDLRDFEWLMVVGSRRAGHCTSETGDLLGFSQTAISRFNRQWCEKRKYPVSSRPVGKNDMLTPEVRGGWTDWI